MQTVLFDDVVYTDYGQFDIVWSESIGFNGDADVFFAGQLNGVVGAASGTSLYANFGRSWGGSRVRIVLLDHEPDLASDHFEDVVEVSITLPVGSEVSWSSWAGETGGPLPGLDPGTYRVRVSAHGRDAGRESEPDDPVVDEYLFELWPGSVEPDCIVRVGSRDAANWHAGWGNRR